jgi:hypothetical protein
MPRLPKRPARFVPCPACGQGRWVGSITPVCDECVVSYATPELLSVMSLFRNKSAPLTVTVALCNALIADCTENRFRAAHAHLSPNSNRQ